MSRTCRGDRLHVRVEAYHRSILVVGAALTMLRVDRGEGLVS